MALKVEVRGVASRNMLAALIALMALQVMAPAARAQAGRASVQGQVIDQNGAAVVGSTIRLWRQPDGFELLAKADESGRFRFDRLVEGIYNITVSGAGFAVLTRQIVLSAGETREMELTLQPGAIAEEVVVSINRIAEDPGAVRGIPGSVAVIDHRTLESSRVFTFSEALRKVAGVQVRDEEGFGLRPNIGIRGLNPTRSTKVLLLEDGIPLTYAPYGDNASYYHPPIDRFESIEVLKGSGQILYGPVTVGGVINYITPNPPPTPSGYVSLTGGNRDYFNGHINYGGTCGGTGLLFDYTRKQGEGARENVRSGLNDFNFKALTGIGSRQALTLRTNYYSEDSNITYSGLREDEYRADPRQNPFRNDFFYGDRFGASATHALIFDNDLALTTNLYGTFFRRHWWRQSSNSSQRPNDASDPECGGMANLNTTCGNEGRLREYYTLGLEPRLRASHRLFGINNEADFGVRFHYEHQDRRQENGNRPTSRTGVIVEDNERKSHAYSAFIQNRFMAGDFAITPGVRVEHIRYERTNRLANDGAGVTGNTSLTRVVPGAGVSYTPHQSVTLFAGVHRGFAPPRTEDIINNTTGGSIDLDPELSWNYEAGVRSLFHLGVRVEATFFRMDYENQIIPASLAGGIGTTLTNGGETLHQGVEVTARVDTGTILKLAHNVYFHANYTYLPVAEFRGRRFSNIPGFSTTLITGNRLPYAPEHLSNFTVGYTHPSGVDLLVESVHVSDQFGDDLNTVAPSPDGQRGLIPGYTIWNATANYDVEAMRSTFFVTVKNLLDSTFIVDRTRGILPSSPRLVQAGLKFRF
ncbi:MAG TPA: TonB-dependent receptor [Blastocatellia bacterium]|nr:TonB-dependent receptor [Blastocatellia bacterium]